jgi:hypothetical protein
MLPPLTSPATVSESIESSKQEFPASTDFLKITQTAEIASATNPPIGISLANPSDELAITTPTEQAGVEVTQPTVSEIAVATPTHPLIQPDISLTDLETARRSTEASSETNAKDLTIKPPLQAQSLPADEATESLSPEIMPLDPLEAVEPDASMDQVTNVTQLSDVRPTDWAYEALRSLVERYGCIAGYPDGTFRGNRAMTRYEFAAGLNACLQQIERLVGSGGSNSASKQDLETLRRLVNEFQTELTAIGTRVDNLEGRTARLEANQFSTTTKLFGQAIFGVQGRSENSFDFFLNRLEDQGTNINVVDNVQLSLFTQFSPRSLLLTGLAAGNGNNNAVRLDKYVSLGYESGTNNNLELSDLNFRHLLTNKLAVILGPVGVNPVNVFRGVNRVESAGSGPLSRFAQRNPIINIGGNGGGIGFDYQVGHTHQLCKESTPPTAPMIHLTAASLGEMKAQRQPGAQLVVSPMDNLDVSFQYLNNYSPSGDLLTGVGDDVLAIQTVNAAGFLRAPMQTNAFGLGVEWRLSPRFTIGGWGGYTTSNFKDGPGSVETVNWMAFMNFPDLLGEGNLAGIYVGQPPKITSSDLPTGRNRPSFVNRGDFSGGEGDQPDTTLHLEGFYRIRVTDNISVTPGVIVILNPNHNDNNDNITIGALRTTFTF